MFVVYDKQFIMIKHNIKGVVVLLELVTEGPIRVHMALGHQALAFMLAGATMAYLADASPRK